MAEQSGAGASDAQVAAHARCTVDLRGVHIYGAGCTADLHRGPAGGGTSEDSERKERVYIYRPIFVYALYLPLSALLYLEL